MKRLLILALICLTFIACSKKQEEAKTTSESAKTEEVKPVATESVQSESIKDVEEKIKEMEPIASKAIEKEVTEPAGDEPAGAEPAEEVKTIKPIAASEKGDTEMSIAELWDAYKIAKDKLNVAKEEDDYPNIEKYLLETANYSNKLGRVDIEAWQYNNLGFNLIESFKSKTKYMSATGKLNSMVAGIERNQYRAEIKGKFLQHKDLLLRSEKYLETAEKLDSTLEESSRTTTIESNKMFIKQVLGFIS